MHKVIISYLKMTKAPPVYSFVDSKYSVERLHSPISTAYYLELYHKVGDAFHWMDRLVLTQSELSEAINKPESHIYLLKYDGEVIGFSELVHEKEYVELLYFGLFTSKIGNGHGSAFLQMMITKAWTSTPQWLQLNTCTLDHPKALRLYQKMGFVITNTEIKQL